MKNILILICLLFSFFKMDAFFNAPFFNLENDTLLILSDFEKIQIPQDSFENELLQTVIECLNEEGNANLVSDFSDDAVIEYIQIVKTSITKNQFEINLKIAEQFEIEKESMLESFQEEIRENRKRLNFKILGSRDEMKGMIFKGLWNGESVTVLFI